MESCALIIVQANNFVFKWPFNWCQMKSNNELHCVRILAAFLNFISCPWYYPWCSAVVGKALSPSITWHWRPLETSALLRVTCGPWHRGVTGGAPPPHNFYRYYFLVMETYWHHLLRNHCLDLSISIFMIYTLVKINSAIIVACTVQGVQYNCLHLSLKVICASRVSQIFKWSIYFFSLIKIDAKNGLTLKNWFRNSWEILI